MKRLSLPSFSGSQWPSFIWRLPPPSEAIEWLRPSTSASAPWDIRAPGDLGRGLCTNPHIKTRYLRTGTSNVLEVKSKNPWQLRGCTPGFFIASQLALETSGLRSTRRIDSLHTSLFSSAQINVNSSVNKHSAGARTEGDPLLPLIRPTKTKYLPLKSAVYFVNAATSTTRPLAWKYHKAPTAQHHLPKPAPSTSERHSSGVGFNSLNPLGFTERVSPTKKYLKKRKKIQPL